MLDSYTSGGSLNARYITPGLDANLSMTRNGSTYYYMTDGPPRRVNLGSIRNVVDASETVENVYDYYAFGNTLGTPTTGVTNPFEYTAREFENGSVNTTFYYRNRYYMSALGVFMGRDARWADEGRGWPYIRNNPVNATDPDGQCGIGIVIVILVILGVEGCGGGGTCPPPPPPTPEGCEDWTTADYTGLHSAERPLNDCMDCCNAIAGNIPSAASSLCYLACNAVAQTGSVAALRSELKKRGAHSQ